MKTTQGMRIATVWKLCIEMWDWIAERIRAGDRRDVDTLKDIWCEEHGYSLEVSCFFCDKAGFDCRACPAREIDTAFDCYVDSPYIYSERPLKFHAKLHRMNKKRLKILREKRK